MVETVNIIDDNRFDTSFFVIKGYKSAWSPCRNVREVCRCSSVIGSGPTGAAYARVIRDEWPEARILMVEAGPDQSETRRSSRQPSSMI